MLPSGSLDGSAVITATIRTSTNPVTFVATVDDSCEIWVDGQLFHTFLYSPNARSVTKPLPPGVHDLVLRWRDTGGVAKLNMVIEGTLSASGVTGVFWLAVLAVGALGGALYSMWAKKQDEKGDC
jgi:hypothetical protein